MIHWPEVRLAAAVLVLAGVVASCSRAPEPIRVRAVSNEPYFYKAADGKMRGLVVDVLDEVNRRGNVRVDYELAPPLTAEDILRRRIGDVLPMMVDTPERRQEFYLSDPWLQVSYSLLMRRGSEQKIPASISYRSMTYAERIIRRDFSQARAVPMGSGEEVVRAVCTGTVEGAFLESRRMLDLLMARPAGCESERFHLRPLPGAAVDVSVASRKGESEVADRLRSEIGRMMADGEFVRILSNWTQTTSREAQQFHALERAKTLQWVLAGAAAFLASLFLVTSVQSRRFRKARDSAIRAGEDLAAALRSLRESEATTKALLDSSGQGVVSVTRDGLVLDFNTAAERMFGYTRSEVIGRRVETLMPEGFRGRHEALRAEWFDKPSARAAGVDLTGLRKNGSEFPVEISLDHVQRTDGASAVAFVTDVTDRKRLQSQTSQASKMEAIGQLAGGVAHDFNNLLTVIAGYSQMLARVETDGRKLDSITEIQRAADRAAGLTAQLLAFSRRQIIQPRRIQLNELVAGTEKLLRRVLGENIRITTRLACDLHPILADPGQIEQVLLNLAVNSRDAMPTGGQIQIETANVTVGEDGFHVEFAPGEYARLTFTDDGQGMAKATAARIFEPFFTTKDQGKGTGLGLSTVYGIVRQSGGYVEVASEIGRGTQFQIYFPRMGGAIQSAEEPQQPPDALAAGSETILLVEDEEHVRRMTARMLQTLGYHVLRADGPIAARHLCRTYDGAIDLLVTDVVLPGQNGRDLAAELLADRPRMKVLFMSGYADVALFSEPGSVGSFLPKPFTPEQLSGKVREELGRA